MNYFQVRISRQTAQYFQYLQNIYENEFGKSLTQASIISQAVEDVSVISKWNEVINDDLFKINFGTEITDKDLRIRVQLSPQIQESIQNYKYYLPQFVGSRSITAGVTLKYIFKGAILIRENPSLQDNFSKEVDGILDKYDSKLQDLVAPINKDLFDSIFRELKNEILSSKNDF